MPPNNEHQPAGGTATLPPIVAADLQPGDEVTLRATISPIQYSSESKDLCVIRLQGGATDLWARIDSIVTHTPKPTSQPQEPILVGSIVDRIGSFVHKQGCVMAIHDQWAWISWPKAGFGTEKIDTLRWSTETPKPRPLAPGDRVTSKRPHLVGPWEIVSIHEGYAWVHKLNKSLDTSSAIFTLDTLERAQ